MKKRSLVLLLLLILSLGLVTQVSAQPGTPDTDGDGLPDTSDRCPNQAGPRTNDGCPVDTDNDDTESSRPDDIPPDSDGDGTADPLDACPSRPGDGNNRGCPDGVDPNNPDTEDEPPSSPAVQLVDAPPSDDCIASPEGAYGVNMRSAPNPYSAVLHVLEPNEWAKVLFVSPEGEDPFRAEHEFGNMMQPLGLTLPDPDPDPDPDPEYDPDALWLFIQTDDFHMGWINLDVARLGGDCAEFDELDNTPDYLDVLVLPNDGGGIGFPAENTFLFIPVEPDPDPMPTFEFDIRLPDEDEGESLDLVAECVWVEIGAGGMILECLDGSTPAFIYCLIQEVGEAGHFEEVCYQIELPDGCTMTSPEAGIWHMECDDDGGIVVTPFGWDLPLLIVEPDGETILIALLLPAVQAAR